MMTTTNETKRAMVFAALYALFENHLGFAMERQPLAVGVEEELQTVCLNDLAHGNGALELTCALADYADEDDIVRDEQNGIVLAVKRDGVVCTTDAGKRQIEMIYDPVTRLRDFAGVQATTRTLSVEALKQVGYIIIGSGHHPWAVSELKDWVPKQRYQVLVDRLGKPVLRSADTAGLQATVDTRSLKHMFEVSNVFNRAAPFMAAMTLASPLYDGRIDPSNKGRRHFTWNGLASQDRMGVKCFRDLEEYLTWVIDLEVLFFLDEKGHAHSSQCVPFWQWAFDVVETGNTEEMIRRFNVHTACAWPEARIRPFNKVASVEGRTPCAQPTGAATSVVALYVGLAERASDALCVLEQFTTRDLQLARTPCAKIGFDHSVDGRDVAVIARELLDVARQGLQDRGQGEESELDTLYMRVDARRTPADNLIEIARRGEKLLLDGLAYAA